MQLKSPLFFSNFCRFKSNTLAILNEHKSRWEIRVPLTPQHVSQLIQETGARVLVQPSTKRIHHDQEYLKAGAVIQQDIREADICIGVKEVPSKLLMDDKTYLMFSHTHKGQEYNLTFLQEMMRKKITLIDYELFKNENGKRIVQFSYFAGVAGMVNCLHGLGDRLLGKGLFSPFLNLGLAHHYLSIEHIKSSLKDLGKSITEWGLQRDIGPLVFVFTGKGNVFKGANEIFSILPHEWIKPDHLATLKEYDSHKVYGCLVEAKDYCVHKHGNAFSFQDYTENPQNYYSIFHEKIAPYATVIVNGLYWEKRFPRLISTEQMCELYRQSRSRLLCLADISCDLHGPFEFMGVASTLYQPFYYFNPMNRKFHYDSDGDGIQIMSIDHLPTQVPKEASQFFSQALYTHIRDLVQGKCDTPVLSKATILNRGKLSAQFSHLAQKIIDMDSKKSNEEKNILILGSGYVAGPVIDYLHKNKKYNIIIGIEWLKIAYLLASNVLEDAQRLARERSRIECVKLDVTGNHEAIDDLVVDCDIVISLIPATLHGRVAERCVELKTPMVTASYVNDHMASLNESAKRNNVLILNEIGLDPGIDHLTAMSVIDEAKSKDYKVSSFISWCGGLPAPENSDNPFGYKFSWNPRGVLTASMNPAKYLKKGKIVEIPGSELLSSNETVEIYPGFNFEGLPNRDCLKYQSVYGLEEAHTVFRGTLRYKGFCNVMSSFYDLGLLSNTIVPVANSWRDAIRILINSTDETLEKDIRKLLSSKKSNVEYVIKAMKWLKLLSKETPILQGTDFLSALCSIMSKTMTFAENERDMVCLHHIFELEKNDKKVLKTSTLVVYGTPKGDTAMAKTVGIPVAIAADMILSGNINQTGIMIPTSKEIYEPILSKLKEEGIVIVEKEYDI